MLLWRAVTETRLRAGLAGFGLFTASQEAPPGAYPDEAIRRAVLREHQRQRWRQLGVKQREPDVGGV